MIPPSLSRDAIGYFPDGWRLQINGTSRLILSKSESSSLTPASLAIAIRWRTRFVEEPVAMAPVIPLRRVSLVRIFLGVMPSFSIFMTSRPEALAIRLRLFETAGAVPAPGSASPKTSESMHIEFAVPRCAQEPTVGNVSFSTSFICSGVTTPASTRPGNSRSSEEQKRGLPST